MMVVKPFNSAIYGSNACGSLVGNYKWTFHETWESAIEAMLQEMIRLDQNGWKYVDMIKNTDTCVEYKYERHGETRIVAAWEEMP